MKHVDHFEDSLSSRIDQLLCSILSVLLGTILNLYLNVWDLGTTGGKRQGISA